MLPHHLALAVDGLGLEARGPQVLACRVPMMDVAVWMAVGASIALVGVFVGLLISGRDRE